MGDGERVAQRLRPLNAQLRAILDRLEGVSGGPPPSADEVDRLRRRAVELAAEIERLLVRGLGAHEGNGPPADH